MLNSYVDSGQTKMYMTTHLRWPWRRIPLGRPFTLDIASATDASEKWYARCLWEMISRMSTASLWLAHIHIYTCWPTWLTSASTVTWLQLAKAQKLAYPTYCKPKKKTQLKATLLWIYPKHWDRTNVNQKSIQQIRHEHDTIKLYFSRTKKISPDPC